METQSVGVEQPIEHYICFPTVRRSGDYAPDAVLQEVSVSAALLNITMYHKVHVGYIYLLRLTYNLHCTIYLVVTKYYRTQLTQQHT